MFRYVLRRVFWALPALVLATVVLFAFLARLPARPAARGDSTHRQQLPTFINLEPRDVRTAAAQAAMRIAVDDSDAQATAELVRLGGAALPYVLPLFDALPPQQRERVALALQPVALRMGLTDGRQFSDGSEALVFWSRTWAERSVDFVPTVARRAVARLASHGSRARRAELIELDTYALPWLLEAMGPVQTAQDLARAARLAEIAAHATGRAPCVLQDSSVPDANHCIALWRAWWLNAGAEYRLLSGPDRVVAMLVETRYGHWALEAVVLRLGIAADGVPLLARLRHEGVRTVGLAGLALLLAYCLGVPLGLLSAWRHRGAIDAACGWTVLLLFALPWPFVAWLLLTLGARGWAAGALGATLALVGAPSRQTRVAALDVLRAEPMRFARAKGVHPMRLLLVHGARSSTLVAFAMLPLDFPLALSGACVLEHALGLHGIGRALIAAANDRDVSFLMAFGLAATAANAVLLVGSDLACAWLDPRVRRVLSRGTS
jgi:ABC-type dipeptide/oligopeptide/nickel transport system permease component